MLGFTFRCIEVGNFIVFELGFFFVGYFLVWFFAFNMIFMLVFTTKYSACVLACLCVCLLPPKPYQPTKCTSSQTTRWAEMVERAPS